MCLLFLIVTKVYIFHSYGLRFDYIDQKQKQKQKIVVVATFVVLVVYSDHTKSKG